MYRSSVTVICLIGIIVGVSLTTIHAWRHDQSPRIGKHVEIGKDVIVEENSKINDYTKIGSHVLIKRDSYIGRHVTINEYCIIGKHVDIYNRVTIDLYTTIDDKSEVRKYTKIGRNVTIGGGVSIGRYCTISKNNTIGSGSTLEKYVTTEPNVTIDRNVRIERNTKISANTYIGKYSSVGLRSTMGESVVIHENVKLPKATKLESNQIVIQTPTSYDLYQICARHVTDEEAKIAAPKDNTISPEFNKYLGGLIDQEMKYLTESCTKTKNRSEIFELKNFPKIVSLYLINYHGFERFTKYVKEVQEYLNDERSSESETFKSLEDKLQGQCHLVKCSKRRILEEDVREKFIELLVIDQDAKRDSRVLGDTFCKMVEQIQSKKRNITFAKNEFCGKYCKKDGEKEDKEDH